jgi:hypothetical protein
VTIIEATIYFFSGFFISYWIAFLVFLSQTEPGEEEKDS